MGTLLGLCFPTRPQGSNLKGPGSSDVPGIQVQLGAAHLGIIFLRPSVLLTCRLTSSLPDDCGRQPYALPWIVVRGTARHPQLLPS